VPTTSAKTAGEAKKPAESPVKPAAKVAAVAKPVSIDRPTDKPNDKPIAKLNEKQPIQVLFDRVLVQISSSDGERRSRAGILIPATAQVSRRLLWAETVAVGPHVRTVKVGDTVLFNPEDRFEVEVHGEEYVILRERDIHAIASPRNDSGTGLYL